MTAPIPFAGLAPDARVVRGSGSLAAFDLEAAIGMGQELRRTCDRSPSAHGVATNIVDAVNGFEQDRRPACVLVRAFVTRKFAELPEELQAQMRGSSGAVIAADQLCLRLVATRGLEAEWNDEARSTAHRAIFFGSNAAPMVTELERQLRIADAHQSRTGTFHIADALASSAVPEKRFVRAYGVQSAFGFGARVWPGEVLVVIAFSRAPVGRKAVRAFETIACYARLAWLRTEEARAALDDTVYERLHADAMDDLLVIQESAFRESIHEERRTLAVSRAEAKRASDEAAAEAERHTNELRRTQNAMLSLIEDLREAREALATKVELRTLELASVNRELESRNRELEEFVYIASHDLQEPLRTVAGYMQMIERRYASKLGTDGDEFIRFAIEGAQRMQALIESLLSYSRVATADKQFEGVALDVALDTALRNLALRIEETGTIVDRLPLPTIQADRLQMVQLFQNLVGNAIKFAGDRPPRVHVSAEVEGDSWRIDVRDEGIGFDPKFSDRIFKVFRRLRRDTAGTGIGLAICKKIAERHGGSIAAKALPGQGATFSIHFPLKPTAAKEDAP